jgi:OmpA-OmpF porin, OOP family
MRLVFILIFLHSFSTLSAQPIPADAFKPVNSAYDEQNPLVSPDGSTLFFTISNHPGNVGGKRDPGDIWVSRRTGDQWSTPVHGGTLINDRAYNAVAGISSNGAQLYLHGHYDPSGNMAKTQGISVATQAGSGWTRPLNISIPYFQNKSGMISGTVTQQGKIFIFSAETYGTHGVDDIYVSINEDGKWSEPKNLGATINTQFQEMSPSLSADGKTLYYSSNGRKGNGSFDVYSAERLDDSWTKWSTPVNLGDRINSGGRELFYRLSPALGSVIYTSTINSDGYGDIRSHTPEKPLPQPKDSVIIVRNEVVDTPTVAEPVIDTVQANRNVVKVYGKVLNTKTQQSVPATIAFIGPGINQHTTQAGVDGYSISIPSTDKYRVTIEANGFVSTMENLDIDTYEMTELEMNFSLQPVAVGTTVNLKNVLFAQTKADVLPESYPELDLVVNFLKTNENVRIELAGHTDNRGIHADNVKLSQQRVNRVKDYLVSKGVESRRISGRGYGGTKPIASNDTEESRRMNRRVEFIIKKL